MNTKACKIYAFIDPNIDGSGNPCYLALDAGSLYSQHSQTSIASCKIQPVKNATDLTTGHYRIECKQNNTIIQCCGHGMLTAAHFIKNQLNLPVTELNLDNKSNRDKHNLQLYFSMIGCETTITFEKEIIWLEFEEIECYEIEPPAWSHQLNLPVEPLKFAQTSKQNGYCIVQFKDDTELQTLTAPDETIKQFTKRAVIYTSKSTRHTNTFCFRYFAPQYGNPEDTATGSAIRVLANFWKCRNQRTTFNQLSSTGGLLFAERANKKVRVGGICRWDNT